MLRDLLWQEGTHVGRKHVATLMRKMCIQALYRKPNLSRKNAHHKIYPVLSWRVSNTMHADSCIEAVEDAIALYGKPDIFNTDQGIQYTSEEFTGLLRHNGIAISMDGKGCWLDNMFVERLWKSVKYEEVYLHACDSVSQARDSLKRYFESVVSGLFEVEGQYSQC